MTTTTSTFQQKPDFYISRDDCVKSYHNTIQTNKRYKNFNQTHFTAGDEEQFQLYRHDENNNDESDDVVLSDNLFIDHKIELCDKYSSLYPNAVINTFRYMFNKFKKGVFVKIVNNELKVFLPFSNANFVNEWSFKIDNNYVDVFKRVTEIDGRQYNDKNINNFKSNWYANNSLIRYEYPINEGDTNISNMKNMLEELCASRRLPDIEFFVNRRDFPLLSTGSYEPYYDLWDSKEHPLVSHSYEQYCPILSMSKTDKFADVLIPTHEDWSRVQSKEGKWFAHSHRSCEDTSSCIEWEDKKPVAVFRGSSTGSGVTIKTNQRLQIAYLSSLNNLDDDGLPYIDAGITKWNSRPKKLMNHSKLQVIDVNSLPFGLSKYMTYEEQCKHKFIIHIDGHVSAFRLSLELNSGSVVLIVESEWKMWFSELLKPYEHYVPIKKDMSDLFEQVKWCKQHDKECNTITRNAKHFYKTYLEKAGILDFLQKTIIDVKHKVGTYLYYDVKPLDIQLELEKTVINSIFDAKKRSCGELYEIPPISRCHGILEAIQIIMLSTNETIDTSSLRVLFQNKSKTLSIKLYNLLSIELVVKEKTDNVKENIHELFIGLTCINDILKDIPNFCFTFGRNGLDSTIVTEYIDGITLYDYINSDSFDLNEYFFLVLQICLSLNVAQESCCFVHYDLTPWNIVLQKLDTSTEVEYLIDHNNVFKVKTRLIPIIIDYGKSHVVYKDIHYGFVNMFKFSTCQDILSLIVTSVYQIITVHNLTPNQFRDVLKFSNFISNTKYRKQNFRNAKDLKTFLHHSKKYSSLLYDDKHELENKTPLDLFNYIMSNINNYSGDISISFKNYNPVMYKSDTVQIVEYILSDTNEKKIQTYIDVFDRMLGKYYNFCTNEELVHKLNHTSHNLKMLLRKHNITSYDALIKNKILSIYKMLINNFPKQVVNYSCFETMFPTLYNEETFMLQNKVKEVEMFYSKCNIKGVNTEKELQNKRQIRLMLLNGSSLYKIDRNKYLKLLSKANQNINMMNNIADIKTFVFYASHPDIRRS